MGKSPKRTAKTNKVRAAKGDVAAGSINDSTINIVNAAGGQLTEEEGRNREQQYLGREEPFINPRLAVKQDVALAQ